MIELVMEFIVVSIISIITVIVIGGIMLIADIKIANQTEKSIEKRYVYTILGRKPPSNTVVFKFVESDTKLTYQEIKNKFPSVEIMSIDVLDKKKGKF